MNRLCLLALSFFVVARSFADSSSSVRYAKLTAELRTGQPSLEKLEEAAEIYGEEGTLWWRLGQARLQAKRYDEAIAAYNEALRLGVFANKHASACHYDIACAHALKGDKEKAYKHLGASMDAGWRDLEHLRTDSDLNSLHDDKRWETLAATKDVSKLSRDEAWRYDLWLLDREVRRIHFDAYRLHSKEDHEAWVRKLNAEIPKLDDSKIRVAFMKYMRRMGDGHTAIRFTSHGAALSLPLQIGIFEDGTFVTLASPSHSDLAGLKVVSVGGKPVAELLKRFDEITSQDNPMHIKALGGRFLAMPGILHGLGVQSSEKESEIVLQDAAGKAKKVTLQGTTEQPNEKWVKCRPPGDPAYLKNQGKPYWFEHLPDLKAVYFQYNQVANDQAEPLTKFAERLFDFIEKNDVARLIVDARWNGGGNSFLNKPLVNGIIGCKKINSRGSLFVIIGRNTFSAAQNFVTDLDRAVSPLFVGEPTGSGPNFVGESIRFTLPYSKMQGSISDLYWQRSWPMDGRIWIAPDLPAHPTFEAYRQNRDLSMEVIEAYLKEGNLRP